MENWSGKSANLFCNDFYCEMWSRKEANSHFIAFVQMIKNVAFAKDIFSTVKPRLRSKGHKQI